MCIFTDPKHKTNTKVPIYCTETQSKQKSALLLHWNTKQSKCIIYCTVTQINQKVHYLLHCNTKQPISALFTALKHKTIKKCIIYCTETKSKHKVHYLLQVETQKQSKSTLFTPRRNTKTTKKCTIYCIQKHKTNKLITYWLEKSHLLRFCLFGVFLGKDFNWGLNQRLYL